jgi:3-dehydroquinate synthetase
VPDVALPSPLRPRRAARASSQESRVRLHRNGTTTFRLEVERRITYDVINIRGHVFDPHDLTLASALEDRPTFIVVDQNVLRLYGSALRRYAASNLRCFGISSLVAHETTKTLSSVGDICARANAAGIPREGVLLAVGGGVALDQAGCAAALYRRGIRFARIPTTLTGIVDVGVGIKQGVNAEGRKNLLGVFHPAYVNVCDLAFLESSPPRSIACGLAEIAKIAIVCDGPLFELLERDGASLLSSNFQTQPIAEIVVARAQQAMMDQLSDNLYEETFARLVDFGHTFSPLLESQSRYEIAHGEAVSVDMVLSAAIALELGLCDAASFVRIVSMMRSFGTPVRDAALDENLGMDALAYARAHRGGALHLVVPCGIGTATFVQDVGREVLRAALARVNALTM